MFELAFGTFCFVLLHWERDDSAWRAHRRHQCALDKRTRASVTPIDLNTVKQRERCRHNQEVAAALQENQDCIWIMYGLLGSLCLEVLLDLVEFQASLHIEDTVSLLELHGKLRAGYSCTRAHPSSKQHV